MLSGLAMVNFEKFEIIGMSGNFEQKKTGKVKQEKKRCPPHHRIFFSPFPDVTVLMLLTDFLQGTTLNHCRWCGTEVRAPRTRSLERALCR